MTRSRWLKSLKSNMFFFGNQIRSHVFIISTLGNKTWPMKSQEMYFFACKFSFTYFMGNWLFWQVHENVNMWKLETILWSDQTSCKGHQRGAPLTHDLSVVITTLLRQYLVLMGRTTPIFQLGHYFDLNFTFVTVMSPYLSSLPHVCW